MLMAAEGLRLPRACAAPEPLPTVRGARVPSADAAVRVFNLLASHAGAPAGVRAGECGASWG